MKKMLVWSMLFLAWGGVVSCSDDDNALRPVSMAVGLPTGEGSDVALDELTSFDYLVWNSTTGELVPIEGAEQGVASLDPSALASGAFQLNLSAKDTYQVYAMAVRETAADGGMTATIVNPTRTEQMIDPRTVVWKTDVDGELQQTDLFHGVATLSAANAGQLELERAVGQVSIELPDRETVTIDSLALEVPEDKLSLAILRDGTLVKGTEATPRKWAVPEVFYMLPMEEPAASGAVLHVYVTTQKGEAVDCKVSLDEIGFQVKKDQCLHVDLSAMSWNETGELMPAFVPVVEWGEVISMELGAADVPSFIPGDELWPDMDVYYYYGLLNEAQQAAYLEVMKAAVAFDDDGSALARVTIPIPMELERTEITELSNAVTYDLPSLFHLSSVANYGTYKTWITLRFAYPYEDYVFKYKAVLDASNAIIDRMPEGLDEYGKAKYCYEELLKYVTYGQLEGSAGNLYGAFGLRKIVCEGYARAYQYLCQRVGLQAIYMTGNAYPNDNIPVNHAWNIVRIDGKYYYADPTFDDGMTAGSDVVRYDNFLKSAATFGVQHDLNLTPEDITISSEDYPLDITEQ